jgi:hypothetical protein
MKRKISKSEFAALQNLSRGRISQLLKQGVIKAEENGLIDWRRAEQELKKYRERRSDPFWNVSFQFPP